MYCDPMRWELRRIELEMGEFSFKMRDCWLCHGENAMLEPRERRRMRFLGLFRVLRSATTPKLCHPPFSRFRARKITGFSHLFSTNYTLLLHNFTNQHEELDGSCQVDWFSSSTLFFLRLNLPGKPFLNLLKTSSFPPFCNIFLTGNGEEGRIILNVWVTHSCLKRQKPPKNKNRATRNSKAAKSWLCSPTLLK